MSDGRSSPGEKRLAVRVTKDALKHVRRGHPWVFDASITSVSHDGAPGDLAVIFDDRRNFVAIGLWDPASPIRIRVLHHGRPLTIDDSFWRSRFALAAERRRSLLDDEAVTGCRLVHGENDGLPGLVIDRYGDVCVVKLYSGAWFAHLTAVVDAIRSCWEPASVVLRLARTLQDTTPSGYHDGAVIAGEAPPAPTPFLEAGAAMSADPIGGQKTGYFLDQRANRLLVGAHAADARVLDVFCCHGGFSVHAAIGGARQVHSVDLSPHATEAARRHVAGNAPVEHRITTGDAFQVMEALTAQEQRYDVVVVDPPSFASRSSAVPGALRAYARLTHLALGLVEPGGVLFQASCSSRVDRSRFEATIEAAAERAARHLDIEARPDHDLDHPIGFPEGAYLKAVLARVDA